MSARIFAFDTETTGLSAAENEIISIAMILLDGSLNEMGRKVIYALPEKAVDPKAAAVNGYTREGWLARGAVSQEVLYKEICFFLHGHRDLFPLGHNISFDVAFLEELFKRHTGKLREHLSYHKIDTVGISVFFDMAKFGSLGSMYRLTELTQRFAIKHEDAHDALSDVVACVELFKLLYTSMDGKELPPPPVVHSRLLKKEGSDWVFRGGKNKEKSVTTLVKEKPDYLEWVLKEVADLSDEQRDYIRNALSRV